MVKDTIRYVQECLQYQKERSNRRLDIKQEIDRPKEV